MLLLSKVSNGMFRLATKKYAILLALMFIAIIAYMENCPFGIGKLKEISNGTGMLDMKFGYDQVQVYTLFNAIGKEERLLYGKLLGLDVVFAVIFMIFQSILLSILLRKVAVKTVFQMLNLLPFARSGLDMLENCLLFFLLSNYPAHFPFVVMISSVVTIAKWIIYVAILGTAFSLGAILFSNRSRKRIKEQLLPVKTQL